MFTGRVIDGVEAAAIGLANRCVPDDQLEAAVARHRDGDRREQLVHQPHRQAARRRQAKACRWVTASPSKPRTAPAPGPTWSNG